MRKIASFYYLNYPDNMPEDPLDAYSEVYVEVGDDESTIDKFEETFSFHIYTFKRVKKLLEQQGPIISRSVIILNQFDDKTILAALESIIDNIGEFGTKVGI